MGTSPSCFTAAARAAIGVLLGGAALAASGSAAAQTTATGRSEAIILRPLSFFKVDDLDFGSILANPSTAGTVRLQPNGTRTATGGVVLVGNDQQPARFTGLGTRNQQVSISLQSNAIFITGPGAPMRVRTFEIGSTPTALLSTTPLRFRITSTTGAFAFPLGAILEVGANQTPGDYVGSFTISLNYL
jgi:Domain of unknown function (DUF4402)